MAAGFRSTPQELVLVVCAKRCCVVVSALVSVRAVVYTPTQCLKHTQLLRGPNRLRWHSWFLRTSATKNLEVVQE